MTPKQVLINMTKKYLRKDINLKKKKQKIIDDLRLIQQYNNAISKNYKFVK